MPIYNTKQAYQLSLETNNLKVVQAYRRQMVNRRHQTPQIGTVAKPEPLLLIILTLVCEYDIREVHDNLPNPLFETEVCYL